MFSAAASTLLLRRVDEVSLSGAKLAGEQSNELEKLSSSWRCWDCGVGVEKDMWANAAMLLRVSGLV